MHCDSRNPGRQTPLSLVAACANCVPLWQVHADVEGAKFHVCPKKAEKWAAQIKEAIDTQHMDSGSAQKLAGRLNFATQHLFHKLAEP